MAHIRRTKIIIRKQPRNYVLKVDDEPGVLFDSPSAIADRFRSDLISLLEELTAHNEITIDMQAEKRPPEAYGGKS